jgi:hypothetical protein
MARVSQKAEGTEFVIYRGQKMSKGWPTRIKKAQKVDTCHIGTETYSRIPYGNERHGPDAEHNPCPDCGAIKGQLHVPDCCEVEECPRCHGHRLTCDCRFLSRNPEPTDAEAAYLARLTGQLDCIRTSLASFPLPTDLDQVAKAIARLSARLEQAKQVFLPTDFPSLKNSALHAHRAAAIDSLVQQLRHAFSCERVPSLLELQRLCEQLATISTHLDHSAHDLEYFDITPESRSGPDDVEHDVPEQHHDSDPDAADSGAVDFNEEPGKPLRRLPWRFGPRLP